MNFRLVIMSIVAFSLALLFNCTSPVSSVSPAGSTSKEDVENLEENYFDCTFTYFNGESETATIKTKKEPVLGMHGQVYLQDQNQDGHRKVIRAGVRKLTFRSVLKYSSMKSNHKFNSQHKLIWI